MTNTNISQVSVRNGIVAGLVVVTLSLVLYLLGVTGTDPESSSSSLSILFLILVLAWATHKGITEFRNGNGGFSSFGQCIGIGTLTGLVVGVIMAIYSYIFLSFIDPTMIEKIRENIIREYEKNGMSEEQIEQALGMVDSFMGPAAMAISNVFSAALFGFLVGLVAGMFMKKIREQF